MMTAQPESFRECLEELKPLLPHHYDKLSLHKGRHDLRPQFPAYFAKETQGELCFIALRKSGRLIGYWICFVAPGLHYETCLTSIMDIWFILPDFITTVAPKVLMDGVERELKRRGVHLSFVGEKLHSPCGRLFELYGYKPVERTFSKWIAG